MARCQEVLVATVEVQRLLVACISNSTNNSRLCRAILETITSATKAEQIVRHSVWLGMKDTMIGPGRPSKVMAAVRPVVWHNRLRLGVG